MWKNYFLASFRFLMRYKNYTLLNLVGLSIGIASSIFIFLWVMDELSYDKHHKNYKNIVRLVQNQYSPSGVFKVAATPAPYSPVLKDLLPEVKNSFRIRPYAGEVLLESDAKKFYEKQLSYADSSILSILTFEFIYGDKHALDDKNNVIITESTAKRYFGNENPFGKILTMNNEASLKVSAVIKDLPHNSHIQFDVLLNFERLVDRRWNLNWNNNYYYCYFLLEDNVDYEVLNTKFADNLSKYVNENLGQETTTNNFPELYVQPLEKIHLYSDFNIDLYSHTQPRIQYIYFFSIIGFVILLITAINYTNLAIARYTRRTIEVGIRKTCGASRIQLTRQFLFESVLLTLMAYLIGTFLVEVLMHNFNQFTDKNLSFSYANWRLVMGAVSIILFTGLASGSYPAIYLSSLLPINAIKGTEKKGSSNFRKTLVIVQFVLGAILITGTLTVYKQLNFIQARNLGLNKEQVIYFTAKGEMYNKFNSFKQELMGSTAIKNITHASALPTYTVHSTSSVAWGKDFNEDDRFLIHQEAIEHDYLKTLEIEIVEGRNFEKHSSIDSANFIVNEMAVQYMKLDNPIDEEFILWGDLRGRIIGVMKDFNFKSLHKKVEPLVYRLSNRMNQYIMVRLSGNNIQSEIEFLKNKYEEFNPAYPFEYHFLDEEYDKLYKSEKKTAELFTGFSIIAIFLACLGFFGLASYMAEQKTKEIAVRKVFGSSPKQIAIKLIWGFTKWILIANAIAIPVANYILNNWLENFAYHTSIGYGVFLLTTAFTILIAISAQLVQVLKAIHRNPASALKYE